MNKVLFEKQRWLHFFTAFICAGCWPALVQGLPIQGEIFVKPITVRPAGPSVSDRDINQDFQFANKIYSQIGITVNRRDDVFLARNDPDANGVWSINEFRTDLIKQGREDPQEIPVYYVENLGGAFGFTVSEEDVNTPDAPVFPGIIVDARRRFDTMPHEIGHVLHDEFRFKSGDTTDGGIHSNSRNDLMARGGIRNIPVNINDVAPMASRDEIPNKIGTLSTDGTARLAQVNAFYNQSSFVKNIARDPFIVEFGMDGNGDGNIINTDWGLEFSTSNTFGNSITVNEIARKVGPETDEISFWFEANDPLAATGDTGFFDIWIDDIDWFDGLVKEIKLETLQIDLFEDDMINLMTLTNFAFAGAANDGDLDFHVAIAKEELVGKRDIRVMFQVTHVPEPGMIILIMTGFAGLIVSVRRRKTKSCLSNEREMSKLMQY